MMMMMMHDCFPLTSMLWAIDMEMELVDVQEMALL